jgi:hypothetical protein
MSKYNKVNPGQYKISGREKPGQGILHEQNKQTKSMEEHALREEAKKQNGTDDPGPAGSE